MAPETVEGKSACLISASVNSNWRQCLSTYSRAAQICHGNDGGVCQHDTVRVSQRLSCQVASSRRQKAGSAGQLDGGVEGLEDHIVVAAESLELFHDVLDRVVVSLSAHKTVAIRSCIRDVFQGLGVGEQVLSDDGVLQLLLWAC